jgi:hypothetical protein
MRTTPLSERLKQGKVCIRLGAEDADMVPFAK